MEDSMNSKLVCNTVFTSLCMLMLVTAGASAQTAVGAPAPTAAASSGKTILDNSVLERFRTYAGSRSPGELTALFSTIEPGKVRQQPKIALSDGSTALLIAVKAAAVDTVEPMFTLRGASLVSVQKTGKDEWVLKAIPDKGVWIASLQIIQNAVTEEYPLTVAPPLPQDIDLSEQGFDRYLQAGGDVASASRMDLNNDGKYNYVDDYIFAANYLAKQVIVGNSLEARRQRALKRTLSAPDSIPAPVAPSTGYDGVFYGEQ
jgi:hypothetical protein